MISDNNNCINWRYDWIISKQLINSYYIISFLEKLLTFINNKDKYKQNEVIL